MKIRESLWEKGCSHFPAFTWIDLNVHKDSVNGIQTTQSSAEQSALGQLKWEPDDTQQSRAYQDCKNGDWMAQSSAEQSALAQLKGNQMTHSGAEH